MKITYVLNSSNYGGMEWHVVYLAEGMVKNGHEVFVWCPQGGLAETFRQVGAKVIENKIIHDFDISYIFRLSQFLRKNNIDIVHAHELKAVVNALLASSISGVKVKITHTHTPISEWKISKTKKLLNIFVYNLLVNMLSTYEMALTKSRAQVKIKEGISSRKIKIIESANPIKIQNFVVENDLKKIYRNEILKQYSIPQDALVWGCIGRITKEKGHQLLVDAFAKYLSKLPSEQKLMNYLLIAGGGELETSLRESIAVKDLLGKAIITGAFDEKEKTKYYSSLDCFIHPSYAEGFGIVLLEAMVVGVPIIASNLEVFQEVGGGLLNTFEVGNVDGLVNKMDVFARDVTLRNQNVAKLQQRVAAIYSFENFVDSYEKFYLELLK